MSENNIGGEELILEIGSKNNLMKVLECPICFDVYVPPVYACVTGHPLCFKCVETVKKCPQCREDVTKKFRCYPLESVLQEIIISCKYQSEGCKVTVTCAEMDQHAKVCKYRLVKCNEWQKKYCKDVEIPYSEFLKHLKTEHECTSCEVVRAAKEYFLDGKCGIRTWPTSIIECFDRHFLMRAWIERKYLNIYVVFFGTDDVTGKYNARVNIGHPEDGCKRYEIKICNLDNFRVLESDPQYFSLSLPKARFVSLGQEYTDESGVESIKLLFSCNIELNEI